MGPDRMLSGISMDIYQNCLTVLIKTEMSLSVVEDIQNAVLQKINRSGAKKVIMDFSGVEVVDSHLFELISSTYRMIALMGTDVVLTGFTPGVVASLVDSDVNYRGLIIKRSIEEAIDYLTPPSDDEDFIEVQEDHDVPEESEFGDSGQQNVNENLEIDARDEDKDL
ncbi:STAS domain-containing protein [bacterium]|nr:STAS domain-containing protein [bacterium]